MRRGEHINLVRAVLHELEWPTTREDADWRLTLSQQLQLVALDLVKDDAPPELRAAFRERVRAARGGGAMPSPASVWDLKLPFDRCRAD